MEFAWAAKDQVQVTVNTGAWHAISSASPIVQLILLILVVLSVVSWAIIYTKRRQLQSAQKANANFLEVFWKAPSLDAINQRINEFQDSPLAQVFHAGFLELQRLAEVNSLKSAGSPQLSGIDNLSRALRKASDNELGLMENNLGFLATTSSNAPFIGLFGTVWGIMGSFQHIGATGSASLAVVAPGISEALIATAVGLAAAIPAGAAYNFYIGKVRREELEMNSFCSDFLNIAKRNFFKDE